MWMKSQSANGSINGGFRHSAAVAAEIAINSIFPEDTQDVKQNTDTTSSFATWESNGYMAGAHTRFSNAAAAK